MKLFNSKYCYGVLPIVLHWLSALAIITLFSLGLWMKGLDYYDGWYNKAPFLHKSLGVMFLCLALLRLAVRLVTPVPVSEPSLSVLEHNLARVVHYLLYGLTLLLPVTGYLVATAKGQGVSVFGWFELPALIRIDNSSDWMSHIHAALAWAIISLAALHALAALKHHFIDKDATLKKMLGIHKGDLS